MNNARIMHMNRMQHATRHYAQITVFNGQLHGELLTKQSEIEQRYFVINFVNLFYVI